MPEAFIAAWPSGALSQPLPLPVGPWVFLFPDWMVRGLSFAQDAGGPEVGKTDMSRPISAMIA